jgi:phosphoribosylaminoimidazole carboxylase (NCAIR synthetase)
MTAHAPELAGRRLVVLGTWDMREAALATWAELGIEATLVDRHAAERGGPALRRLEVDVWDSAAPSAGLLDRLVSTADGVVTLAEFCTVTAARAARDAGLPGPGLTAAMLARDKIALRRRLAATELLGPRFAAVRDERDIAAFFRANPGEAVLKPADSAGSTAVYRVGSVAEAAAALPGALRWSFSGQAILEQFIPGPEFSVEALVHRGATSVVAIVEKATIAQRFVEYRHLVPARTTAAQSAALTRAAESVVSALGVQNAVVHAEFRLGPEGFVLIEIAVRPAGGLIPDLLRLGLGIDLYGAQAALALGLPPQLRRANGPTGAGVQFVTGTGTIQREVSAEAFLEDHPGIDRAGQLLPRGTEIPDLDTNGARAGFVMAAAESREALSQLLEVASIDLAITMGLTPAMAGLGSGTR